MKNFKKIFYFGEKVEGYEVPVLNEREVRGASGIFLFFAILSIFFALFLNNFYPSKIFVTVFLLDFIIRVLINPKFSPSLIFARWIVSNQIPEYVGAPQKRFAWIVGLILALIVFVMLVVLNMGGYWFLCLLCFFCLIFLFFESIFGICMGCKFYDLITDKKAHLCPGGVCEVHIKEKIQEINKNQWIVLIFTFIFLWFLLISNLFKNQKIEKNSQKIKNQNQQCDISNLFKD